MTCCRRQYPGKRDKNLLKSLTEEWIKLIVTWKLRHMDPIQKAIRKGTNVFKKTTVKAPHSSDFTLRLNPQTSPPIGDVAKHLDEVQTDISNEETTKTSLIL